MKQILEKIFIYGASGHAKVVIDIILKQRCYEIAFLVDDDISLKDTVVCGYPVVGGKQALLSERIRSGIVAIGSNGARSSVAAWLRSNDFNLISAIHPAAQLSRSVNIGDGTVVMAGSVINSDATIGRDVIINTRASIDHDCIIEDNVHIAPGVTICGSVKVGAGTFVCAGATIIPNLTIGRGVIVGAGSTVIRPVPDNNLVVGCPARSIKILEGL